MAGAFEFADRIFEDIGTQWCALDILHRVQDNRYFLLETSLGWPWPSPGDCDKAPFFGTKHRWDGMWEVMLDEYEAGAWTVGFSAPSITGA